MTIITTKTTKIDDQTVLKIIILNHKPEKCYGITNDNSCLIIDCKTGKTASKTSLDPAEIQWNQPLQLHLSPNDRYIAITNKYGQYGAIYDTKTGNILLKLDRKTYHIEQTYFPIAFFEQDSVTYLIHGINWNKLELTEIPSGKTLSERAVIEHDVDDDRYLDYFYGELHISPNNKTFLSSGWVWQPVSVLRFTDLQKWFSEPYQPEMPHNGDRQFWSYYWDRALCWIDDETVAFLYDPLEEGDLDEEDQPEDFETGKQYIVCYHPETEKIVNKIEVTFPVNQYHEADGCKLFFNQNIYLTSGNGVQVIDPDNGFILEQSNLKNITQFHPQSSILYSFKEHILMFFSMV